MNHSFYLPRTNFKLELVCGTGAVRKVVFCFDVHKIDCNATIPLTESISFLK